MMMRGASQIHAFGLVLHRCPVTVIQEKGCPPERAALGHQSDLSEDPIPEIVQAGEYQTALATIVLRSEATSDTTWDFSARGNISSALRCTTIASV